MAHGWASAFIRPQGAAEPPSLLKRLDRCDGAEPSLRGPNARGSRNHLHCCLLLAPQVVVGRFLVNWRRAQGTSPVALSQPPAGARGVERVLAGELREPLARLHVREADAALRHVALSRGQDGKVLHHALRGHVAARDALVQGAQPLEVLRPDCPELELGHVPGQGRRRVAERVPGRALGGAGAAVPAAPP
eukprot:CAMPEP_0168505694 /NCGR_PEP_ID=MMETSP0228-20121227/76999_1 /TAXON_ID=133427 /ORGANISM="Protoceratium reticulatum, Strain CCCM 535 (=CCMP 1889)" /LENGTH=190 /DNA_ID=CAMNT_0008522781 /DNA_START=340 /DNA_END=909 /DNA_ORIENTATION=-